MTAQLVTDPNVFPGLKTFFKKKTLFKKKLQPRKEKKNI